MRIVVRVAGTAILRRITEHLRVMARRAFRFRVLAQ